MSSDWSRRTFLSAAGAGLLPRRLFAPLLAPASGDAAMRARLAEIDTVARRGPFTPSWESLEGFKVPDWYVDGKFGIFIHWGVYSSARVRQRVVSPEHVQGRDGRVQTSRRHVRTASSLRLQGLHPALQGGAVRRRPVGLAVQGRGGEVRGAGCRAPRRLPHVCVSVHGVVRGPDGAAARHRRPARRGRSRRRARLRRLLPSRRALVVLRPGRDLRFRRPRSALRRTLRSRARPEGGGEPGRAPDPAYLDDWLLRTCDLVDRHRPQLALVRLVDCPARLPGAPQEIRGLLLQPRDGVEQGRGHQLQEARGESFPDAAGVLDVERGQLAAIRPYFWQTDTAVAKNSWGYTTHQEYKTAASIVEDLVDIVSKNGALLLNIGPRPDGTIPEGDEAILRQIGGWLSVNGEAIYGTRPWRVFGEGPTEVVAGPFADTKRKPFTAEDIRFTARADTSTRRPWPGRTRDGSWCAPWRAREDGRTRRWPRSIWLGPHGADRLGADGRRAGRDAARRPSPPRRPLAAYRLLGDAVEARRRQPEADCAASSR